MEIMASVIIVGILGAGIYSLGFFAGQRNCYRKVKSAIEGKIEAYNRFKKNFMVAYDWLLLEKKGGSLVPFFQNNFPNNIVIYGYGKLGQLLYQELENAGIKILFILDKKAGQLKAKIPIYSLKEKFPWADLIVVTTDYFYQVKDRVNELGYDTEVAYLGDIIELMLVYADEIKKKNDASENENNCSHNGVDGY